jgi:hypothetical protein
LTFSSTFFLTLEFLARLDGYFATRTLASDWPIELKHRQGLAGVGGEVEFALRRWRWMSRRTVR